MQCERGEDPGEGWKDPGEVIKKKECTSTQLLTLGQGLRLAHSVLMSMSEMGNGIPSYVWIEGGLERLADRL